MTVGFAGIGIMGLPMATRLLDASVELAVWSRRAEACAPLVERGALLAADPDALFAACDTVVLMLRDELATDAVLGRGTPAFARRVAGRRVIVSGTNSPAYSEALAAEIHAAGGSYVEAPVSGSRVPAERGELVVMLAGRTPTRSTRRRHCSPRSGRRSCGAVRCPGRCAPRSRSTTT
ncbi:NAD(P)-dependent oxidoreductase [Homoserinibacter gongjuensis]|nr:NAD(P)-binding domain-containing protein [Homoserinibacter gongjuensis]